MRVLATKDIRSDTAEKRTSGLCWRLSEHFIVFLVGQPVPPRDRDRVRNLLLGYAGVTAVRELVVTYVGPEQVWVLARIDIAGDLSSSQVTSLVSDIEAGLERESKYIYRVDIVAAGTGRGGCAALL